MNFKKWKLGLLVALLSGLFTGIIGWGIGMTTKQIVFFTLISVAKDGWLYLVKHPVDAISWETNRVTRDDVAQTTMTESRKTTITTPEAQPKV